MNYISRNLETVVNQVTKEYPIVLVTGPRQMGKTTMLQKLMENTDRDYVSFADMVGLLSDWMEQCRDIGKKLPIRERNSQKCFRCWIVHLYREIGSHRLYETEAWSD